MSATAGVIHQHVELAELVERVGEQSIDVFLPRNVGVDSNHVAAGGSHLVGRTNNRVGFEPDDRHLRARASEMLGDHAAQAARSTGH
jgi:hypothetical protein